MPNSKDLLDRAESMICNATPLAHCSGPDWDMMTRQWMDEKHLLFPDGARGRELHSAFVIGQRVYVSLQGVKVFGHIRAIIFTSSKVRYSIRTEGGSQTTIHNIDSAFVCSEPNAEVIDMPEDNYS